MPSNISHSTRLPASAASATTSAQAMSNTLWLATPTRIASAHSVRSADSSIALKLASTSALVAYGACSQPCSSDSTRSMARLAPFTMRTLVRPPPRSRRATAHCPNRSSAPCESGT